MSHTRNGRVAKAKRQERASDRKTSNEQFFEDYDNMGAEEKLLTSIFGAHVACSDCGERR